MKNNDETTDQINDSIRFDGDYLKILKAGNGDSLILRFLGDDGNFKNVLIDGGNKKSDYTSCLKSEILDIQERKENIDLLIITHTDQDHVKGVQYLLEDSEIDKNLIKTIWFNSFDSSNFEDTNDISYIESCKIQELISKYQIPRKYDLTIDDNGIIIFFGATITLLSPQKEDLNKLIEKNASDISSSGSDYDYSIEKLISENTKIFKDEKEDLDTTIENRVSIAFLLEVNNKSILFLGDANPDIVCYSIKKILESNNQEKLKVDIVKLSHHASDRSFSLQLGNLIETECFIVSANGKKSNLPNKLTFAKILNRFHKSEKKDCFIFNYEDVISDLKFTNEEFTRHNFICSKPNYINGYIVEL